MGLSLSREEERTCQLFAAVAVHTLNRSFETAVEKVRGVSQLQLLYEEFARLVIELVVWWLKINVVLQRGTSQTKA